MYIFLVVLLVAGSIAFGVIWEIFRRKCPSCGKFFAREILSSASSHTTHHMGEHTHKTTVSQCQCKFCGHRWEQKYTSTKHRR